ncbi:hypothetical protein AOQ84DRAFT_374160 [Glonium stellatum]|uniref:Nephrocystin 3-like N-terminal domain-containing protein n=1 Tax=Glonium stellatum TaxID=574774 RepID=A0A8E2JW17_9PEZI|nr:hypothetical protein AOQ84DRAFT_374160 [Glonium stellatum]
MAHSDPPALTALTAGLHPALSESHHLSSDIYPPLFHWFFASKVFHRWCEGDNSWQLHCIGGPGSGKTTLSALTKTHLLEKFRGTETFVASIFIQEDVISNDLAFLEDFLCSIYSQLTLASTSVDEITIESYEAYEDARYAGKRAAHRINLIQKATHARLSNLHSAFLVLDGFDRCSPALGLLLERELSALHEQGMSIMLTSRLPVFEKPEDITCDIHEPEELEEILRFFWECTNCNDCIMCFPCREKGSLCRNCQDNTWLVEPYEHVNFAIGQIPTESMRKYVAWDLEKEHGDLGFGILNESKPPLSKLGFTLREDETGAATLGILTDVVNKAFGNVSIAKLELDLIHSAQSMETIESTPDRQPRNLVALFDEGIKQIDQQPPSQRDLGLKAIAAAGRDPNGVPLVHLERLLRDTTPAHDQLSLPPRSLEDVLRAARGFLFLKPNGDRDVALYHTTLPLYVTEGYNQSLMWAISQLRASKISRSVTRIDSGNGNGDEPGPQPEDQLKHLMESIKFEEPHKADLVGKKSVFALSRSATAFSLANKGEVVKALRQIGVAPSLCTQY